MNGERRSGASWGPVVAVLVAALGLLFYRSLAPGLVLFSNDAQFGMISSTCMRLPGTFRGLWQSIEWLGVELPGATVDFSQIFGTLVLTPLAISKFYVPFALAFLGFSAAVFARSVGLRAWVVALAALAACLNSNPVSYACWGLPPKAMAIGCALLAMAALSQRAVGWRYWAWGALAGFATGLNVMEGGDVGAILSLFVAAYAILEGGGVEGFGGRALVLRGLRLGVVVLCAGWIAAHAVTMLVGTSIVGIRGMAQDAQSRERLWAFATGWSLPPIESLRIVVPGLFGYRMDTPGGGAYWGAVGPDGTPQNRHSAAGEYAGALVVLVGGLAVLGALRGGRGPYQAIERRRIWFFAGVAFISLLLAFGHFAPFYQAVFALPYFSTIRAPTKFLHVMHMALVVLFAYGAEGLFRLRSTEGALFGWGEAWRRANPLARRWLVGVAATVCAGAVAALVFTASRSSLEAHMATIFPGNEPKLATPGFAIGEAWLAVLCFAVSGAAAAAVVLRPAQAGRLDWPGLGLAVVLTLDLARANRPWVKYYDYRLRTDPNAVVELLREQPWEHRVTAFMEPTRAGLLVATQVFVLMQHEWLENHFPYYDIQTLDIDQMPRMPDLESAFLGALSPGDPRQRDSIQQAEGLAAAIPNLDQWPADQQARLAAALPAIQADFFRVRRLWELTNTRYVLGWQAGLDWFNRLFDPEGKRFSVKMAYALAPKPGVPQPTADTPPAEAVRAFTAVRSPQGPLAVLEFSGALPRAKLYHRWEVLDDQGTLVRLRDPGFDPAQTVVLSAGPGSAPAPSATAAPPGAVTITDYQPRRVVLHTKDDQASVLLLNDRWHARWFATVDGRPASCLRANFLMRGVPLPAGEHTVEFSFQPPAAPLGVSSLGLLTAGILLVLVRLKRRGESA